MNAWRQKCLQIGESRRMRGQQGGRGPVFKYRAQAAGLRWGVYQTARRGPKCLRAADLPEPGASSRPPEAAGNPTPRGQAKNTPRGVFEDQHLVFNISSQWAHGRPEWPTITDQRTARISDAVQKCAPPSINVPAIINAEKAFPTFQRSRSVLNNLHRRHRSHPPRALVGHYQR